MERLTESFVATGERTGKCTVNIYTKFVNTSTHDGQSEMATTKRLTTSDGRVLNYKGKGLYQVVDTGEMLKSADPKAP
jgi:hypothetical protein